MKLLRSYQWSKLPKPSGSTWGRLTSYVRKARAMKPRGALSYRYDPLVPVGNSGRHALAVALARSSKGVSQLVVLKGLGVRMRREPEAGSRIVSEARLMARMRHPNVVAVHGMCHDGPLPVIALEYLEGQSLASLMDRANTMPQLSLELRLGIICRVLAGLDHVHELKDLDGHQLPIIHGAICPSNIMLTYDGQVKLIDFSQAVVCPNPFERGAHAYASFPYMAPEQVRRATDQRVDIFSVGVVLWEMLAQVPLWGQVPESLVYRRLVTGAVPRLREIKRDCDPELDAICAKAMATHPGDRFETAKEMLATLERYLASHSQTATNAELGTLLLRVFADERREMQGAIQARIGQLGLTRQDETSPMGTGQTKIAAWLRRRSAPNYALLCAMGFVALSGTLLALSPGSGRVAPPLDFEARRAPPWPNYHGELVAFDISIDPPHAALYLDGQRLSSNPLTAYMVKDGRVHTLRGEAAGFDPFVKSFRLDLDVVVDASLRPARYVLQEPAAPPVSRPATRTASTRRVSR